MRMSTRLVLTVIGVDKPGLVDRLATVIAAARGSWLESRMARLAGHFAGIVEVALPADALADFETRVRALEGLSVSITRSDLEPPDKPLRVAQLAFVGQDRPGLVQAVSRVLAASNINVDELDTRTFLAPMSGTQVFEAQAELHLPDGLDVSALRERLEAVARDVFVDIHISEDGG